MTETMRNAPDLGASGEAAHGIERPVGQIVLVLQGGGALGAYQAGVYQGLSEAGIEPDWVVGTSIGAINGAIIAGNEPKSRISRLRAFWDDVSSSFTIDPSWHGGWLGSAFGIAAAMTFGVPGFFRPQATSWNIHQAVGVERAAFYTTEPLRQTLGRLIDFVELDGKRTRLTVGAVNVLSGEMRYFDSRDEHLTLEHVMASGALPPAFPAVRIGAELYWDGGIYSNTPVEVVLDDRPRRNSLIFTVNMWQPRGAEPLSVWQVMGRQKDIQYASRASSHIARQEQIHQLRHVVRQLAALLPKEQAKDPIVAELASYGCATTMHLVRLLAPGRDGEDQTKDIDFSPATVRARWDAGYAHAARVLREKPWHTDLSPLQGVIVHESSES